MGNQQTGNQFQSVKYHSSVNDLLFFLIKVVVQLTIFYVAYMFWLRSLCTWPTKISVCNRYLRLHSIGALIVSMPIPTVKAIPPYVQPYVQPYVLPQWKRPNDILHYSKLQKQKEVRQRLREGYRKEKWQRVCKQIRGYKKIDVDDEFLNQTPCLTSGWPFSGSKRSLLNAAVINVQYPNYPLPEECFIGEKGYGVRFLTTRNTCCIGK